MQYINYQKYFIRSLYKSNENMDITNIKSIFKNKFNLKLTISKEEIYKEKYNNKKIDIFYDYTEKIK